MVAFYWLKSSVPLLTVMLCKERKLLSVYERAPRSHRSMGVTMEVALHSVSAARVHSYRKCISKARRRTEVIKLNRLITKSRSNSGAVLTEKMVVNKAVEYIDQLHEEILNRLLNGEFSIEIPIVEHIVRSYLQNFDIPYEKRIALEKLLYSRF
uniref:BHLH domain-containing protein n=1 Tax=Trichuris muris TaxID=70415 RepID=A0A5S6QVM9_TRIMR